MKTHDDVAGAMSVAMAIVPTLYSRNKLFALYADPAVRHARSRARLIRSVLRQLASGTARDVDIERGEPSVVTYKVPSLHMSRRVELSPLELACLLFLATKSKLPDLEPTAEERVALDHALATLPTAQKPEALDT